MKRQSQNFGLQQPNLRTLMAIGIGTLVTLGCHLDQAAPPAIWLVVPVSTQGTCSTLTCATTAWDGNNHLCYVTGLRSANCACYQGQTRSCDMTPSNSGNLCAPGSTTCGVEYCTTTGTGLSATSNWETSCHPI